MLNEKQYSKISYELKKLFGINDRQLSKTEEGYLEKWHIDYGMSVEMIALAYEYCIIAINKLSFPYMNTILKRWAEQGIRTIPEAEADHESHKKQGSSGADENTAMEKTNDVSEIERQFMEAYINGDNNN
jgi:DnaD/phage-associated family protein